MSRDRKTQSIMRITNPKLIQKLELADEDIETFLITMFNVFEKLEIQKIVLSQFLEDLYRTFRDENHPSVVKNILARISERLDVVEEKMTEL